LVDLHSHILPGLDDGAADLEASMAIARAASADGTQTIVATPHVSLDYDTHAAVIADGVKSLAASLQAAGIELELIAGAEVAAARLSALDDDSLRALCIGPGPYLLVESPYSSAPFLEAQLFGLQTRGFRPLLAHPERCALFQRDRARLERLVAQGMLCSVTAGSIAGRFGRSVRRFTHDLLRAQLVHDISSDAHDTVRRPPGMSAGAEGLCANLPELSAQADWYTHDVAEAVVRGEPIPRRPRPGRGLSRAWRARRRLGDLRRS